MPRRKRTRFPVVLLPALIFSPFLAFAAEPGPVKLSVSGVPPENAVFAQPQEKLPPPKQSPASTPFPIDLPTALRLADAQNPLIQFARERIQAAAAELDRARVLWLPNLTLGATWLRHDGQIQDTRGPVIPVSRSALFTGGGATFRFRLADALYEPLAARQHLVAHQAGERAVTNELLLEVALAYWDLVRAHAELDLAQEALIHSRNLDELAQSWLKAGKLKPADAERVKAEYRLRLQELDVARERTQVLSARLAQPLRLDPFVLLQPTDRPPPPVTLVDMDLPPADLVALALSSRPELDQSRALAGLAQEKLRQARQGPLLPSLILDYRAGGFGGGPNSFFGAFDGRADAEATLVWEFRNLGLGDRALQRQRASDVRQAQFQESAVMDRVAGEVATAQARVRARRAQMKSAELAVQSAGRSLDLNFKLFKEAGLEAIRPLEVMQAIQAFITARQNQVAAVIEHNRSQFQLHWALGYPVLDSGYTGGQGFPR